MINVDSLWIYRFQNRVWFIIVFLRVPEQSRLVQLNASSYTILDYDVPRGTRSRHCSICLARDTGESILHEALEYLSCTRYRSTHLAQGTGVFILYETLEYLSCTRHWSVCLVRDTGVFILHRALEYLSCTKHWSIYLARDTVVYILYETL